MNTGMNPVFKRVEKADFAVAARATFGGISLKTGLFLITTIILACVGYFLTPSIIQGTSTVAYAMLGVAGVIAFISAFVGVFIPSSAKYVGFIYAASEGYCLGVISGICSVLLEGTYIVELALLLTVLVFAVIYLLYQVKAIRNSKGLRHFLMIMTFCVLIGLLVSVLFSVFGINVFGNYWANLVLSIFLTLYASFSLIFNFDEASAVVALGCPKEAEWQVAFGLTISLLYIYIQILQLLIILFSSNSK